MKPEPPSGDCPHGPYDAERVPLTGHERALLTEGIRLNNSGAYFAAHEVLEEAWLQCATPNRRFLQAIIHIAVANHHAARENRIGAIRQFEKSVKKLQSYPALYEQIDVRKVVASAKLSVILLRNSQSIRPDVFVRIPKWGP